MDAALVRLSRSPDRWITLPLENKVLLLERVLRDLRAVAQPWANACADAKGLDRQSPAAGEEWMAVAFLLKGVAMLRRSLQEVAAGRPPRIPGPIGTTPDGGVSVQVFPGTYYDRLFYPGMTAAIWTERGVTERTVRAAQASIHPAPGGPGKTVLVLGAGNASLLGPSDILGKLFCENAVVVYKTHPVTDYLTPLLEHALGALIRGDFLQVVRGGAEEGAYLASHPLVDELHLTGSDRTYDALVFGAGEEGARRKAARKRLNEKPFTCELGNVSPVIVVPGPWSTSDLAYQAEHLAGMLVINAGFNCLTTRVIIQHAGWARRRALLDGVRRVFARTPTRVAYYPGAREIHVAFTQAHPEAEFFGSTAEGQLPWTLIPGVDAARTNDICFAHEGFCSLFAETALDAPDAPTFLERAVRFANDVLWGSLTATILVHPASLRDRRVAEAVERAVAGLRYGTVGVNLWGMLNYATMAGSWGAFPGHPFHDIGSGQGTVHNYLMIPRPQKTVIRGPFRQWPKPVVFPSHRTLLEVGRRMVDFEAAPSPLKLPGILQAALRA
ncbi:MAG: aldehyde dehydrogenase family protein [Gemmatimonadetes bacterium]|nr:aldehyde dehydrogenase family protein [Gemmatimonadota bacterium]